MFKYNRTLFTITYFIVSILSLVCIVMNIFYIDTSSVSTFISVISVILNLTIGVINILASEGNSPKLIWILTVLCLIEAPAVTFIFKYYGIGILYFACTAALVYFSILHLRLRVKNGKK